MQNELYRKTQRSLAAAFSPPSDVIPSPTSHRAGQQDDLRRRPRGQVSREHTLCFGVLGGATDGRSFHPEEILVHSERKLALGWKEKNIRPRPFSPFGHLLYPPAVLLPK